MVGKRDMTAPLWARKVKKARRLMRELLEIDPDIQIVEPPNFETAPTLRRPH